MCDKKRVNEKKGFENKGDGRYCDPSRLIFWYLN